MDQNKVQLCLQVTTTDENGVKIDALSGCPYPAQLVPDILKFMKNGYSLLVEVIEYSPASSAVES